MKKWVCLLIAALILLFCSQCSPLYPINVWADPNCLLTVGRVMKAGGVVYRDIYEQKGPTLYLLHMLASFISDKSFFGVFLLEVLSLGAALWAAGRMMRGPKKGFAAGAALLGVSLVVSRAFVTGDSAEEFCLPLILGAMALAFSEYEKNDGPMRTKSLMLCGLLAGLVATIKFTLLGAFVGLCLCEGILALRSGGFRRALMSAGAFLAGMLTPILLWGVYFAANGALDDAVQVYLYNNVMLYAEEGMTLSQMIQETIEIVRGNWLWLLLAVGGLVFFLLDREEKKTLKLCALSMAVCQFAAVFLLGRVWPYSPMAMGAFAVLGVREIGKRIPEKIPGAAYAVVTAGLLAAAFFLTPNRYLRFVRLEDTAQGRLAAQVEPGSTLLQYSYLDDGLYLTTGTLPEERFFVRLNVRFPEMDEALDRAVQEGKPDYVLLSWRELPEQFGRYELAAQDLGYREDGRPIKPLYLYRRMEP